MLDQKIEHTMQTREIVVNFEEKKHNKKPERKVNVYTHPVSGETILHGEETWFRPNGLIKERRKWKNDKKEGLDIMNYQHSGSYDKAYLFRTYKSGEQNGIQIYFHKH